MALHVGPGRLPWDGALGCTNLYATGSILAAFGPANRNRPVAVHGSAGGRRVRVRRRWGPSNPSVRFRGRRELGVPVGGLDADRAPLAGIRLVPVRYHRRAKPLSRIKPSGLGLDVSGRGTDSR